MTQTPTGKIDLEIPSDTFRVLSDDFPKLALTAGDLRAIAAPVVAAELRRIARGRELGGVSYTDLRARADELDPPASKDA